MENYTEHLEITHSWDSLDEGLFGDGEWLFGPGMAPPRSEVVARYGDSLGPGAVVVGCRCGLRELRKRCQVSVRGGRAHVDRLGLVVMETKYKTQRYSR